MHRQSIATAFLNLRTLKKNVSLGGSDNDDTTSASLLPNTPYNVNYKDGNLVVSSKKTFELPNVTTFGSTSYTLVCDNGNISIKYQDELTPLVSGKPTTVNSYTVEFTQEQDVDNVCNVSDGTLVGTIDFQLCGIPSGTTSTALQDGKTTHTITGLQAYTFTQLINNNSQTINFGFFLMNNENELTLLGTINDPGDQGCSNTCSAISLTTSRNNRRIAVSVFNDNKKYYYQIYFSNISTIGNAIDVTIDVPGREGSVEGPC